VEDMDIWSTNVTEMHGVINAIVMVTLKKCAEHQKLAIIAFGLTKNIII
jgi:hypothetical protein